MRSLHELNLYRKIETKYYSIMQRSGIVCTDLIEPDSQRLVPPTQDHILRIFMLQTQSKGFSHIIIMQLHYIEFKVSCACSAHYFALCLVKEIATPFSN